MCLPRRALVLALITAGALTVEASAVTFQWSQRFGDSDEQNANAVVFDDWGNLVIAGEFKQATDFGGGALSCGASGGCLYLAKFDRDGNELWSRSLGDSLNRITNRVAIDAQSNIYLASDFKGTVDFGPGAVSNVGFRDGVVAKFDATGNAVWCRSFGGAFALVEVEVASADPAGNVVVAGKFTNAIDFGGATLSQIGFSANTYIVKFDTNGNHVWSRQFTSDLLEIMALQIDTFGDVAIAGYHSGNVDFGGGTLNADLFNVFIAKFDAAGTHTWSHTFGSAGTNQQCFDMAMDGLGNLFITGHFGSPLDLGGGALTSAGDHDIFLAKFSAGGTHLWSQRFGDANQQRAYTVSVDGGGNVVVGGYFFGSIDFGGGALTSDPLDFFVAGFDGDGGHLWSERFDVAGFGLQVDQPHTIVSASSRFGAVAFGGPFQDSVDCGGGPLNGAGSWDIFLAYFGSTVTGISAGKRAPARLDASPNPFNPQTVISYSIQKPGTVQLRLFDVRGRLVRTLAVGARPAGSHSVTWNARDDAGAAVASGVYFLRLDSGGRSVSRRLVLLK